MRYLCVHCNQRFEAAEGDKPRCPICRRVHGLEPDRPAPRRPRWVPYAIGGVIVALLAGGYAWWAVATPPAGPVPLRPLSAGQMREYARRAGLTQDRDRGLSWLSAGPAIRALVDKLRPVRSDSVRARADALFEQFQNLRAQEAFVPFAAVEPRDTAPKSAERVVAALRKGARFAASALELNGAFVAAAREAGVPAMLAEVTRCPGVRAPLDPSGCIGHFAAAVAQGGDGDFRHRVNLYDVHRGVARGDCEATVLSDVEAAAAFLNLRAFYKLSHGEEGSGASRDSEAAIKLAPRFAPARLTHANLLLDTAPPEQALNEFRAAAGLRPDAARRRALAGILFALNDLDAGARELRAALEEAPDYAFAHLTMAALHLSRGERAEARGELDQAERFDPTLPNLPLMWAHIYASEGQPDQAIGRMRDAVARRPGSAQARVVLADLYKQTSRYDEMCRELAAVLRTHANDERLTELIERQFGRARLEEAREGCDEAQGEAEPAHTGTSGATAPSGAGLKLEEPGSRPRRGLGLGGGDLRLRPGGP